METINGVTTYFVGNYYEYEANSGQITKYYYAGANRVAMRKNGTLNFLLGDHLGSTSLTTDANGVVISEMRYTPWGEVRYNAGTTPTDYTYTGQKSYAGSFGLAFYNARWYDPYLGRMAQADSIVPPGVQGLDRYAYVNNNPIRYIDPSGHFVCNNIKHCAPPEDLVYFQSDEGHDWTDEEKEIIRQGAQDIANALAREINRENYLLYKMGEINNYRPISTKVAFKQVFGGAIVVRRSGYSCDGCWAEHRGNINGHYTIWIYSNSSSQDILNHPLLIVHEMGHAFDVATGIDANSLIPNDLLRPINSDGIVGTNANGGHYGYFGPHYQWEFGRDSKNRAGEEFADMFVGWVYNQWENSALGVQRQEFMNTLMVSYLP